MASYKQQQQQHGNNSPNLCQECQSNEFRYQCPRCNFRSCSLACCKAHKEKLSCDGKRDKTAFLRLSQMDDQTLSSDYHFLEDVLRNVDSGKRRIGKNGVGGGGGGGNPFHITNKRPRHASNMDSTTASDPPPHPLVKASQAAPPLPSIHNKNWSHLAPRWRHVAKQALEQSRNTKILFMPNGMQRRLQNQTHLKKDIFHWTVEWTIHDRNDVVGNDKKNVKEPPQAATPATISTKKSPRVVRLSISEELTLPQAMQQHRAELHIDTTATNNNNNGIRLLIKQIPLKTYAVVWSIDDNDDDNAQTTSGTIPTLRDVLKDRTVIEFPTIEVVPYQRLSEFPLGVQEVVAVQGNDDNSNNNNGNDDNDDDGDGKDVSSHAPKVQNETALESKGDQVEQINE